MMPPRPMTDLIVRYPGFTLAALEACFDAMFGCGHTGQLPQRCLRRGVGQRKIDLHHLLVVSVAVASHDEQFLVALLPPRRPRHHTSRSEEHTSELQSPCNLVCRLLLEKKKKKKRPL